MHPQSTGVSVGAGEPPQRRTCARTGRCGAHRRAFGGPETRSCALRSGRASSDRPKRAHDWAADDPGRHGLRDDTILSPAWASVPTATRTPVGRARCRRGSRGGRPPHPQPESAIAVPETSDHHGPGYRAAASRVSRHPAQASRQPPGPAGARSLASRRAEVPGGRGIAVSLCRGGTACPIMSRRTSRSRTSSSALPPCCASQHLAAAPVASAHRRRPCATAPRVAMARPLPRLLPPVVRNSSRGRQPQLLIAAHRRALDRPDGCCRSAKSLALRVGSPYRA